MAALGQRGVTWTAGFQKTAGRPAVLHYTGRILQLSGLLAMPSAIWVSELQRNEAMAIGVFLGALLVFVLGYVLIRLTNR